jgi:hypothetical protein
MQLRPVRRLASPWRRAGGWLLAAVWMAALLSLFADWDGLRLRLMAAPDMWMSLAGAVLTAVLAGVAALQLAVPGRPAMWALLPVPAVAVWVGASAAGCLRLGPIAGVVPEGAMHPMVCMEFLLLVSLPLVMLLTWLLMRAYPVRPGLTAALGGLASAGAAAALLALIHPFDATWEDLAVHAVAVGIVILAARLFGGRALNARILPSGTATAP